MVSRLAHGDTSRIHQNTSEYIRIHQDTVFIENPPKSHRNPPCSRVITEAGTDRRFKIDGEVVNFYVHYEIDDDTSRHVLTCEAYGGDGDGSWVLLEALV